MDEPVAKMALMFENLYSKMMLDVFPIECIESGAMPM